MIKKIKVNPFLNVKPHTKFGFLLTDNYNKKHFVFDKKLMKVFFDKKRKDNIVKEFLKNGLFVKSDSTESKMDKLSWFWREYNATDALYYHIFCYKYPFLDYEDGYAFLIDKNRMKEYEKKDKVPSFFKIYNQKKIQLKTPKEFPEFSVRKVTQKKLNKNFKKNNLERLNLFLYASYANTLDDPKEDRFILRTVPSGGAKHPTESYLIFPKNSFYPAGVYHYNVKEHALDVIYEGDVWSGLIEATYFVYSQKRNMQFAVVYTSVVERAMFRYRDLRSTRAIFFDVGHILQNSKQIGYALGLNSITEYKSKETEIKRLLSIDNDEELIVASQIFYI